MVYGKLHREELSKTPFQCMYTIAPDEDGGAVQATGSVLESGEEQFDWEVFDTQNESVAKGRETTKDGALLRCCRKMREETGLMARPRKSGGPVRIVITSDDPVYPVMQQYKAGMIPVEVLLEMLQETSEEESPEAESEEDES